MKTGVGIEPWAVVISPALAFEPCAVAKSWKSMAQSYKKVVRG
jgi:hypothetical protein